jgi:hypothetical protein
VNTSKFQVLQVSLGSRWNSPEQNLPVNMGHFRG